MPNKPSFLPQRLPPTSSEAGVVVPSATHAITHANAHAHAQFYHTAPFESKFSFLAQSQQANSLSHPWWSSHPAAAAPGQFGGSRFASSTTEASSNLLSSIFNGALRPSARRAAAGGSALISGGLAIQLTEEPTHVFQRRDLRAESGDLLVDDSLLDGPVLTKGEPTVWGLAHSSLALFPGAQSLFTSPTALFSAVALERKHLRTIASLDRQLLEANARLVKKEQENAALSAKVSSLQTEMHQLETLVETQDHLCIICCERPKSVVYGCQHMCVCTKCDKELEMRYGDCPLCRQRIELRINVL